MVRASRLLDGARGEEANFKRADALALGGGDRDDGEDRGEDGRRQEAGALPDGAAGDGVDAVRAAQREDAVVAGELVGGVDGAEVVAKRVQALRAALLENGRGNGRRGAGG